tara:strand:- start:959 stop:1273 length:315 start_codon:yes stop_codon:yes gene_type:complete
MSFLKRVHISQMMIVCNSKIYRLTKPQVSEISKYQNGIDYNNSWLIVKSLNPYFASAKGKYRKEIVYLDKDVKIYNKYTPKSNPIIDKIREEDLVARHYNYRHK